MLAQDRADLVEVLVERVLAPRALHPGREQRAAARHDALDALMAAQAGDALARHPAMQRHVVHALARLALDHFEEELPLELHDRVIGGDLVYRHRAKYHRASRKQFGANLVEVGPGREVHHRIRAEAHGGVELLDLFVEELMEVRGTDIGIDLGAQAFADSDRAEVVMGVVRDDRLAAGDESADFLCGEALVLSDLEHLRGDSPFAGGFNLGHVVVPLNTDSIYLYSMRPSLVTGRLM